MLRATKKKKDRVDRHDRACAEEANNNQIWTYRISTSLISQTILLCKALYYIFLRILSQCISMFFQSVLLVFYSFETFRCSLFIMKLIIIWSLHRRQNLVWVNLPVVLSYLQFPGRSMETFFTMRYQWKISHNKKKLYLF